MVKLKCGDYFYYQEALNMLDLDEVEYFTNFTELEIVIEEDLDFIQYDILSKFGDLSDEE